MRLAVALAASLAAASTLALCSNTGLAEETRAEWSSVPVVSLHEAAKLRMVDVRGTQPSGYRSIHVELSNRSDDRVVVDIAGSHLLPERRGSCQRLGIGPAVTPSAGMSGADGSLVVQLEPRETRELDVQTCCLDVSKAVPGRQRFVAARLPLPEHRRNVLRWWAENPEVPQSYVNSAIWRDAEQVTLPAGYDGTTTRRETHSLALHGGVAYQLATGELTALDGDGVRRFLGTQIQQVLPTDDAVYAVATGEDGRPDLWRLAMTGEDPWSFVLDLDSNARILRVIPAGKGRFALVRDSDVSVHARGREAKILLTTSAPEHLSVQERGKGRLRVGTYQPRVRKDPKDERSGKSSFYELWDVNVVSGKTKLFKRFWNVKGLTCGDAGVFALSPRGVLRRLDGKSFRDLPRDREYRAIVAVGRRVLWMRPKHSAAVAIDATTGRRIAETERDSLAGNPTLSVDHVTDALGLVVEGKYFRISPEDGSRTRLELPE